MGYPGIPKVCTVLQYTPFSCQWQWILFIFRDQEGGFQVLTHSQTMFHGAYQLFGLFGFHYSHDDSSM